MNRNEPSTVSCFGLLASRFPVSTSEGDTIPKPERALLWLDITEDGSRGYAYDTGHVGHVCSMSVKLADDFGS